MKTKSKKLIALDLFAGCGGLTEGFEMTGLYETAACVEWEKTSRDTLTNRLFSKWGYKDAEERVLQFDVQRTTELLSGWSGDEKYGSSPGLKKIIANQGTGIDIIVGGPPCQAYSVAGRVRDEHGMNNDYRNYLFETYIKLVNHFKPKAFIFENVPGLLSARPGGVPIIEKIRASFKKAGYSLVDDIKRYALIDASEYGVPQSRKRLILFGIRDDCFEGEPQELLRQFYNDILPTYKAKNKATVADAIFDLPKLFPNPEKKQRAKISHVPQASGVPNHKPRFHSERDMAIFKELALDGARKNKKYKSVEDLKKLYTKVTGKVSSIHKYYVLESDKPSNTIVSHLHKDGLRHIHPDPEQARSITVREAARLQSFPDDFEFLGSVGDQYKMVGNAVPPILARVVAKSVACFLEDNLVKQEESTLWKIPLQI
ncbi:DNA cytosine methyltransferase [Candidatus Nomurabacteria bacterium]|nr:DNA cytosine methyltransferase [Candidatus Nomurabacteria bacterium]